MLKRITATAFCLFLFFFFLHSQIDTYINNKDFDWGRWVKEDSLHRKIKFLTDSIQNLDSIYVILNIKNYYILDIDGNNILDVIFKGPNSKSTFYLNRNFNLEEGYSISEPIINLGRSKPWSPINFQTLVRMSGSENALKTYYPVLTDGKLSYVLETTLLMHPSLTLINENIPPVPFEVLRIPELHWAPNSVSGNVIKMYDPGSHGYAVASSSDDNRRIWWLVLMDEGNQTFRVGWMLRKNLKQLPRN